MPEAAHAVPVGGAARPRDDRRPAGEAARRDPVRPAVRPRDRLPVPRRQARHRRGPALPRRPPGRRGHRGGLARRRPVRRLERALLATTAGWPPRQGARRRAGLDVDWYTTRERDFAEVLPWDHLDSGPRQGLALGGLAGLAQRGRGRGLPLDAVLRLRRLPADGHRDPDRADGPNAAAADRERRADAPRARSGGLLTAADDGRSRVRRAYPVVGLPGQPLRAAG